MFQSKTRVAVCLALLLSSGVSGTAFAQTDRTSELTIVEPWTRATPPRAQTAGGFLTIENAGSVPDRLVGAASPIADRVEIHEMRVVDGTMIMRPADGGLEIPAGGGATLAPGGFHLMFIGLKESLAEGDEVPVVLSFERAGDVEVRLSTGSIGASGPSSHDTDMSDAEKHGDHEKEHGQ